jgi:hypothetical protein
LSIHSKALSPTRSGFCEKSMPASMIVSVASIWLQKGRRTVLKPMFRTWRSSAL